MSNMSYCCFENTLNDLKDCYNNMSNEDDDLSETEEKCKEQLIEMCKDIAEDFGNDQP